MDEVGELSPDIQVKLLRVLQDGEIDPVGSEHTIKVNVRVISATNRCLSDEVSNGNFREDLYYRLNVFPIYIPSLRSRNGDVDMLINHFIKSFAKSENKTKYMYLLTPKGLKEKAAVTLRFLENRQCQYEQLKEEIASLESEVKGE